MLKDIKSKLGGSGSKLERLQKEAEERKNRLEILEGQRAAWPALRRKKEIEITLRLKRDKEED